MHITAIAAYLQDEAHPLEEDEDPVASVVAELVQRVHRKHRQARVGHHRDHAQQQEDGLPGGKQQNQMVTV
jgi:hypothetical protein